MQEHGSVSDEEVQPQKKLTFLSKLVLEAVKARGATKGTEITNEIYRRYNDLMGSNETVNFKNLQRRVYDVMNVLHAVGVISKNEKNEFSYNPESRLSLPQQ